MEAWWKVVRVATLGWKRHTPTRRCPLSRTCGPDGRVHAISEKECPAPVQTTVSLSLSPTTSCERRENAYVRAFSAPLSLSLFLEHRFPAVKSHFFSPSKWLRFYFDWDVH